MKTHIGRSTQIIVLLIFTVSHFAWSQENQDPAPRTGPKSSWFVLWPSDQDVIILTTSIEWGIPDRWSFTTRYVHMFDVDRDHKDWLNNLTATLSPGIVGLRLGFGYQAIIMSTFHEFRAVLLRTWGNPLQALSYQTYSGAEYRFGLFGLINLGIGYYAPISDAASGTSSFWGFHCGVGI